jgi:hypothetical protein
MKISLWLFTLTFVIVSVACWAGAQLVFMELRHNPSAPLPLFTELVLQPHGWLLFCSVPWVIYAAVLSFRKAITSADLFMFVATLLLGIGMIVSAVVVAGMMPYMKLIDM